MQYFRGHSIFFPSASFFCGYVARLSQPPKGGRKENLAAVARIEQASHDRSARGHETRFREASGALHSIIWARAKSGWVSMGCNRRLERLRFDVEVLYVYVY